MLYLEKKKRHMIKTQIVINHYAFIIYKAHHKKKHLHEYNIYKNNRHITPKEVVKVVYLGYLNIEKDFSQQLYYTHLIERKEIYNSYPMIIKNTTKFVPKKG